MTIAGWVGMFFSFTEVTIRLDVLINANNPLTITNCL